MVSIGQAWITIAADTSKFSDDAKKDLESAGQRAGGTLIGSVGKAAKYGAIAVGATIATGVGVALTKGFQRLSAIDEARAKLVGLGHDANSVKTIMGSALAAVKGTAFGLGDAAGQAATLVAAGIKPGQDLTRTLTLLADASTIAGVGMGEMGPIFAKVAAGGKLTTEVVNQLQDRGVPVLQMIGKITGQSMAEVSKSITKGSVDFATFQKAMEQGLGGAAQSSGQTFAGAMANVQAAMGRLGASVMTGVFSQLPTLIGGAITWLDKMGPAATKAGETLGSAFSSGVGILRSVFADPTVQAGIANLIDKGTTLGKVVLNDLLPPIIRLGKDIALPGLQIAGAALAWVIPQLLSGATTLARFTGAVLDNKAALTVLGVVALPFLIGYAAAWATTAAASTIASAKIVAAWVAQTFAATTSTTTQTLSMTQLGLRWGVMAAAAGLNGAKVAAGWVLTAGTAAATAVATTAMSVGSIVAGWVVMGAQSVAAGARVVASWVLMGTQSLLQAARMAAAWVLAMGPVGWVTAAVIALAVVVIKNWDKVKAGTSAAWTAITGFVSAGVTKIQGWFNTFTTGIGKIPGAFNAAVSGAATYWNRLQEVAKTPVRFVINTVLNNGLIKGFNWLSSKIGGPSVGSIPLGFASGGVLPGWSPGRDIYDFYNPKLGRLSLSGGEATMRPEFARAFGKKGIDWLNQLAIRGQLGRVFGDGHGYAGGGIINWIKSKAASSWDWVSDKASATYKAITNPSSYLANLMPAVPGGGVIADYARATASRLKEAVVAKVGGLWKTFNGAFEQAGVGTSNAMGVAALSAWARQQGFTVTSGYRPGSITASGNRSYHSMGRAIDMVPATMATFERALRAFPNAAELIFSPAGSRQLKHGKPYLYSGAVRAMHFNHVHLARKLGGIFDAGVFDSGGVLTPGLNIVRNNTGAPEHLVPIGQAPINVTIDVNDLRRMATVAEFIDMIERHRSDSRRTARSGRVVA